MKKRVLMVLLIAVLVAGVAFAQSGIKLSAGAGGFIGGDFGGGTEGSYGYTAGSYSVSQETKIEYPYFGGGSYAFFDATYAELSVGFFVGKLTPKYTTKTTIKGVEQSTPAINPSSSTISSLNLGLFGKYPFEINDKLSLFPLLGAEYQSVLSVKSENGVESKNPGDFSALWFKAGAGMDFSLTDSIFLRLNVLYGIRLPNKMEQDYEDNFKSSLAASGAPNLKTEAKTLLGHGLTAKLAVGFRF